MNVTRETYDKYNPAISKAYIWGIAISGVVIGQLLSIIYLGIVVNTRYYLFGITEGVIIIISLAIAIKVILYVKAMDEKNRREDYERVKYAYARWYLLPAGEKLEIDLENEIMLVQKSADTAKANVILKGKKEFIIQLLLESKEKEKAKNINL